MIEEPCCISCVRWRARPCPKNKRNGWCTLKHKNMIAHVFDVCCEYKKVKRTAMQQREQIYKAIAEEDNGYLITAEPKQKTVVRPMTALEAELFSEVMSLRKIKDTAELWKKNSSDLCDEYYPPPQDVADAILAGVSPIRFFDYQEAKWELENA